MVCGSNSMCKNLLAQLKEIISASQENAEKFLKDLQSTGRLAIEMWG